MRPIVEAAPKIVLRKPVGIVPEYVDDEEHDDLDDAGESVSPTLFNCSSMDFLYSFILGPLIDQQCVYM